MPIRKSQLPRGLRPGGSAAGLAAPRAVPPLGVLELWQRAVRGLDHGPPDGAEKRRDGPRWFELSCMVSRAGGMGDSDE